MFLNKLIVRTPSLPFNDDISEEFLKQILSNLVFAEALYLASPVLFQEAMNWKDGKITNPKKLLKIPLSLGKYYIRMCSRCTPFGLFAGCGVIEWSDKNNLELSSESKRKTRLDMHYAGALAQKLSEIPAIKYSLKYTLNSSIYRIGEEIRYIEYSYIDGQRKHQISSIIWSDYIQLVLDLCKTGAKIQEIVLHLIEDDISEEQATFFVEQLIDSQLLVSELEPSITGEEFILQIKKNVVSNSPISDLLTVIQTQLTKIDTKNNNEICVYRQVIESIKSFDIPFEEGKLFQTDLVKLFNKTQINSDYQLILKEVFDLFKKIAVSTDNQKLKEFKSVYFNRYETAEIPILIALDTEAGIGYGNSGKSKNTPITEGLNLPVIENKNLNFSQNLFQQYLHELWIKANANGSYQVDLKEEDLKKYAVNSIPTLPSNSITFRLTGDQTFPIYVESIGGSSAANLLGRFAHADPEVLEIIQSITNSEQEQNPNVIFAEIVHLPENRTGNIILHPPFRQYEIPYLAKSSLSDEFQIPLDDLMVSVDLQRDKVILRSKKLNKEIVPRLSNAHNYEQNSLPLYNFLSDLQTQNFQNNFDLNWSSIAFEAVFYPRLTYKNVVISLATWHFDREDYIELITCKSNDLISKIQAFRKHWNLSELFVLADFDNELLVNTNNILSVQIWIDSIKNRNKIKVKEFFYSSKNSVVKNALGQGFTNQFIAAIIDENTVYQGLDEVIKVKQNEIQRNFSVGSEWIYFKFYMGVKVGDNFLSQAIKPLTEELINQKLIDKWFFIRYSDPEKHLRFRVHLPDLASIGKVFLLVKDFVQPFENEGIIWKIQVDSYQREIERYGSDVMEFTETLFYEDSTAVISMIDQTVGEEREVIRWQWCLKAIDTYLSDFGLTLIEKKELMEKMKTNFANEFHLDKALKIQLDQRFRNNRTFIEQILADNLNEIHEYSPLFHAIINKSNRIENIIEQIKSQKSRGELTNYLYDTIHMTVNRTISDNQRLHELVMYDFLFRYYQAEVAKGKI
ncbi:MAG: lantibiotic dehydratase [Arcicella sp.]|nr:lantibiotic dehydratase [Arcicella sp.]